MSDGERSDPVFGVGGTVGSKESSDGHRVPDGRCESNDVLDALRARAVHARELGYAVVDTPPLETKYLGWPE